MSDLLLAWQFWYVIGIVFTIIVIFRHFIDEIDKGFSENTIGAIAIITVLGGIIWPIFWILVIIGEVKSYVYR